MAAVFEANQWIFGYGLSYIYSSGLDDKNLEQVVRGYRVDQHGKRVDALLKTRALASTLCFVEIKTHRTPLLASSDYRRAAGHHQSIYLAQWRRCKAPCHTRGNYFGRLCLADKKGFPTAEEAFNFSPRSFVVVGTLGQFSGEHGVNEGQLRSFELYRRNLHQPEVITFDELYERARHIVGASEG